MDIRFRTNASGSWQDIISYNDVGNGVYNATPSNINEVGTTYWWSVNATDRYNTWTNMTYRFTTTLEQIDLAVSLTSPANNSILVNDDVVFNCNVIDGIAIKNVSLYTNISGYWGLAETKNVSIGEYPYDPFMQLWMHFNNDSTYGENATHLYDFSGKKHNGTATNGAAYSSAGKYGGAYSFDGTDDVVTSHEW